VSTPPVRPCGIAEKSRVQRSHWRLARESLAGSPRASASRLYVESLNEIDMQTVRVSALANRVPFAVLFGASSLSSGCTGASGGNSDSI
jgi:hypothetical protein